MISSLSACQIVFPLLIVATGTGNKSNVLASELVSSPSTKSRELQFQYAPNFASYATGNCGDKEVMHVNFGYYQSWAQWRKDDCNPVSPASLDVSAYTHLAYSFAWINENYELEAYDGNIEEEERSYEKFMTLKKENPFVKLLITVGGWTFSDPGPTFRRFSEAVEDANRPTFVASVIAFCEKYGFEGIDLDWEFPGDYGRGGKPEDKKGYADLAEDLRKAFNAAGHNDWEITIAIPLHQRLIDYGFDLERLAESVDFLNLMAYNLHGNWEETANAHTGLPDLMNYLVYFLETWNFPPEKLLLGLAPYGRTYLMEDENCLTYNCPFKASGPGGCLDKANFMTYFSIQQRIESGEYTSNNPFNPVTATAEMVIDGNVLIDYDSPQSMSYKAQFARAACFGGMMWWAVDMLREPIILSEIDMRFPTSEPTNSPTKGATGSPSGTPTFSPSVTPSAPEPTISPTKEPTGSPSGTPTFSPSVTPSAPPTMTPTQTKSSVPTLVPSVGPTLEPSKSAAPTTRTPLPTVTPSTTPTHESSAVPSGVSSTLPTGVPSVAPTSLPTEVPTTGPSATPTLTKTIVPTQDPNAVISELTGNVIDDSTSSAMTSHQHLCAFLMTWLILPLIPFLF